MQIITNKYKQAFTDISKPGGGSEISDPGLISDDPYGSLVDTLFNANETGANPVGKKKDITKVKLENWKKDPKTIVIER
jgi:hypothetical protein